MITNSEELKKLLESHGLKPTYQRMKILSYLREVKNHPTVDMIYQDLVKVIPTMSKTTVYNTLKSFMDAGLVNPLMITGTEVRYDAITRGHHHFLCSSCGQIMDLHFTCPNMEKHEVDGHQIKELHGYYKGICAKCNKKK